MAEAYVIPIPGQRQPSDADCLLAGRLGDDHMHGPTVGGAKLVVKPRVDKPSPVAL